MKVLIACEESQRVCISFRDRGHEAYSCDIKECSGGRLEWHIMADVTPLLNGHCKFRTCDGAEHEITDKWDLIIAHPPCTYLSNVQNKYYDIYKYGDKAKQREILRQQAVKFFMEFVHADCNKIAIENPVGYMSTHYKKPTQIIQPWQFGETDNKQTCLWLKGLPKLTPTKIISKEERTNNNWKAFFNGKQYSWNDPIVSTLRSRTYWGIAKAMSEQWG